MPGKTIAIGSDHAGFALKAQLADELRAGGHDVLDLGTDGLKSVMVRRQFLRDREARRDDGAG